MPSEKETLKSFEFFFEHVHPYIPVIHKEEFYQQWQNDKKTISPLLLEAMFACTETQSEDPTKGVRWLTLANSKFPASPRCYSLTYWSFLIFSEHKSAFLEAPRLSTIQALLLLLKAREAYPENGYHYRSWQLVKTMIAMAKDLNLHEHHKYHVDNKPCGMNSVDCLVKTRVWQALLIAEVLTGAPQGRSKFADAVGNYTSFRLFLMVSSRTQ